jgi:hypothetical protein
MKPIGGLGILLAIALALAYQGFDYTRQKNVFDAGPIHATAERHERVSIPPLLGGLAPVGGVVLLVVGAKRSFISSCTGKRHDFKSWGKRELSGWD